MTIEVNHIVKSFTGSYPALNDVTFSISEGEMIGFLGPSGCGKTTLLRIIAGLEQQDSGQIRMLGKPVDQLPPQQRGIGFVFQNYALFKHMTVFDNVAFGLRVQKLRASDIRHRVHEVLRLVHLDELAGRYPHQLSGGQAQRVALARALAPRPSVLLLDEPFAAIDTQVRRELRKWIRTIHDEVGITSIFVTHDQEEALEVADRVLVMSQGRVEQLGTPQEVYESPSSFFVANFVGEANHFSGTVSNGGMDLGPLHFPINEQPNGTRVDVVVRPTDLSVRSVRPGDKIVGRVMSVVYKGNGFGIEVCLMDGTRMGARVGTGNPELLNIGGEVALDVKHFLTFTGAV